MYPRHSKEWPRRLLVLTLLVFAGGAQAQDAIVTPPKSPKSIITHRVTDEEALQALQEAKDARVQANCMLAASRKVDTAAMQLNAARVEHREARREALYTALDSLSNCVFANTDAVPVSHSYPGER